jgi:predicted DsbA family dithiol-disulfide isomerase
MSKPVIRVGVVSDVVCPWCYIGKRRLEKAIEQLSDKYEFEVAYYPFELNPDMPKEGFDNKQYLSNKFGGEEQYHKLTSNVTQVAATEGLDFNFEKQTISPNTRNAHRLILIAKEDGKHLEMVEALFKAYFTDGLNLSDKDQLVELAAKVGLDRNKVSLLLESNAGVKEVEIAEKELQRMGIRGVPFYIVNDKYGISGAQPTSSFVDAFTNVANESSVETAPACDVEGENC